MDLGIRDKVALVATEGARHAALLAAVSIQP